MNELEASLRDSVAVLMGLKRDFALVGAGVGNTDPEPGGRIRGRARRDRAIVHRGIDDAKNISLLANLILPVLETKESSS